MFDFTNYDSQIKTISIAEAAIIYRCSEWRWKEAKILEKFQTKITHDTVKEAASLFIVSRNFPIREKIDNRFEIIANWLNDKRNTINNNNIVESVKDLNNFIKNNEITSKTNKTPSNAISASSKFIWCACPDVGIIYDDRAQNYINKCQNKVYVPKRDYEKYVEAFRYILENNIEALDQSQKYLGSLKNRTWQKSKLLDFWLYQNG